MVRAVSFFLSFFLFFSFLFFFFIPTRDGKTNEGICVGVEERGVEWRKKKEKEASTFLQKTVLMTFMQIATGRLTSELFELPFM